ncbi:sensor histidine kinase [Flavisolibacter tropicus]|uniref:sensor histidine kinase n=1 Tax=Flavisolibacter tropicus TaxID=1492898 RepID=UPI0009EE6FB9|nr:HAMP domain-containing sensor histidine kinase [Flavisolibacter tropicus]
MRPALKHINKHIKWMPVLMTLSILAIAAFQIYWLKKAYDREARTLEIRSNMAFRETVYSLQSSKLKLDKLMMDSTGESGPIVRHDQMPREMHFEVRSHEKAAERIYMERFATNEGSQRVIVRRSNGADSTGAPRRAFKGWNNQVVRFLFDMESPKDTIKVAEITTALKQRLDSQSLEVPFVVTRMSKPNTTDERIFNEVTVGFRSPITYRLQLGNTVPYVVNRIIAPILLSVFLVCFTVACFSLLYRNLQKQRKLAVIKNEFISNITHELKTPIATVSVAIEALRSFNSSMDAQKTKEYLDISANELQRLSLLVDKVLKLSMFENKEIDLKYEPLDMRLLMEEVTASLRLQFEKYKAKVDIVAEGDTSLEGDRLHLVSVIYNLIDNALKYSNGNPQIDIRLKGEERTVTLFVRDSGIGIPAEYRDKVFEKFFRVPTGNVHNAKGYGLGLSYVSHVIQKHHGIIKVTSDEGSGSTFIVSLPKHKA